MQTSYAVYRKVCKRLIEETVGLSSDDIYHKYMNLLTEAIGSDNTSYILSRRVIEVVSDIVCDNLDHADNDMAIWCDTVRMLSDCSKYTAMSNTELYKTIVWHLHDGVHIDRIKEVNYE